MADHGDNYQRNEKEGTLSPECGHHCGILTSGGSNRHIGHCNCSECHGQVTSKVDDGISGVLNDGFGDGPRLGTIH